MRVEPLLYKEFDGRAITTTGKVKTFLPGGRHKGEATPPPPTFSEDQLKQAELESYKRGFLEGTEEGKRLQTDAQAEIDQKISNALTSVIHSVYPILEDYKRMATILRQEMPRVSLTIAQKVAGAALTENASTAIQEICERCITTMLGEPSLTIYVHESLAGSLQKRIVEITGKYMTGMDIQVVGDGNMPLSDCKMQWKQGAFIRDTEKLWQDIRLAVDNLSASAGYETTKDMEKLENQVNNPETPPLQDEQQTSQKE